MFNHILIFLGKLTFLKAFYEADDKILTALIALGDINTDIKEVSKELERFICLVYAPKAKISTLAHLRWYCFSKQQMESEQLPPTEAALTSALLRARLQTYIWINSHKNIVEELNPENYGWRKSETCYVPILSSWENAAPEKIVGLISCSCKKTQCKNKQCKCKLNNLQCTDACSCADDLCQNHYNIDDTSDVEEEDD